MKTFKFFLLSIFLSIGFTNCSDPCKDITCVNGSCDEGICNCSPGYDGTLCDNEIRTKYYGIFEGEFTPCIPDILLENLGGNVDLTLFSQFLVSTIIVGPGSSVDKMELKASSPFISFNQEIDVSSTSFSIDETTTTIDDPSLMLPVAITISGNGFGEFVDENTMKLTLALQISIDLFPFPIPQNCVITLTKQ